MSPEKPPICPICSGKSITVKSLPQTDARKSIAHVFAQDIPAEISIADYTMMECTACSLVFASPMLAGGADYYGWITSRAGYSAGQRWEWGKIANHLGGRKEHLKVLEVGCGNGKLMQYLSSNKNLSLSGVDVSAPSIKLAQEKGLDVRLVDFSNPDGALADGEMFDGIILSHVLEHVGNPLMVTNALAKRLNPGGSLYVSVPYSPMSRELDGWDIQNLPPHHLTRWNKNSLGKLADVLGLDLHLETAKAKSPFKRAVQDTCGRALGDKHPSLLRRLMAVAANPKMFVDFYNRHRARERINRHPAGDTALAVFTQI